MNRHKLSDIDQSTRMAWCSGCQAIVDINKAGNGSNFKCGPRNRERAKAWRDNPANASRIKDTKDAYKAANPEAVRKQNAASSQRYAEKRNAERKRLRAEIISAYGGQCNCPGCHVHHDVLLTIDHVNGDGHHRSNRRSTHDLYQEIKRRNFPSDFQLLCGSCNLAKSDRISCPLAGEEH